MPHGAVSPSATFTTSKATLDFASGARVCPANAGFWFGALGGCWFKPGAACWAYMTADTAATQATATEDFCRRLRMSGF
jgi:hypothetical protein